MSAGSAPAVRLERVTVRYGTRAALSSMDLTIAPGEFVALAEAIA